VPPDDREPAATRAAWITTEWTPPVPLPPQWNLSAYVVALLAGGIAWQRVSGEGPAARYAVSIHDIFTAEHLVGQAVGLPPHSALVHEIIGLYTTAAEHHMSECWAWICATADALLERGPLIKAYVAQAMEQAMAPLLARIKELEARPVGMIFKGPWDATTKYAQGEGVQFAGSTWSARTATIGQCPGASDSWVLVTRRGRDGKDLRAVAS
jgi:hypothetical protein